MAIVGSALCFTLVQEFARAVVRCDTTAQCDRYCFHVGSELCIGLTTMYEDAGLIDKDLRSLCYGLWARSTGLFFIRTALILDYYEDVEQKRNWWPKDVWSQYASSLGEFCERPEHVHSMACLNHMITDALEYAPDCIDCMKSMHPRIFEFVAVMQVASMAGLCEMYNNPAVFRRGYELRKGRVFQVITECRNWKQAGHWFLQLTQELKQKVQTTDPNAARTHALLDRCLEKLQAAGIHEARPSPSHLSALVVLLLVLGLLAWNWV